MKETAGETTTRVITSQTSIGISTGPILSARLEFALGTSDLVQNANPLSGASDLTFNVEQVLGADVFAVEASSDMSLWNLPMEVVLRQLQLNGKLRTTGSPTQAFFRLRVLP